MLVITGRPKLEAGKVIKYKNNIQNDGIKKKTKQIKAVNA